MRYKYNRFLFSSLTLICLGACAPKVTEQFNTMGDVYILTSHQGIRELVKISSDCFVFEIECQNPENVSAFPEDYVPYNWANMYWSPNGKYLMLVNSSFNESKNQFLDELLLYNAKNEKIETFISGSKYISGITWSPDSNWAAMAYKKPDDKDMQIVLVSSEGELRYPPISPASEVGYSPYIFNGQVFDNNQRPVLWLNENELIFVRERGEFQSTNPNWPQSISIAHLFKFSFETNAETEIELPVREAHYILSPNGRFAYYTTDQTLKTYNFTDKEVAELKDFPPPWINANWSPDSKWILLCGKDNATYVVAPDMSKKQKIIDGCPIYPMWMPDSDHIILFFFSFEESSALITEDHWFVASISKGSAREITIPNLELKGKNVNGIYVQPIKLSEETMEQETTKQGD